MLRYRCSLIILLLLLSACAKNDSEPSNDIDLSHDYFSFANTEQVIVRHVDLDLTVDFSTRELHGDAILHMQLLDADATEVVLDSRALDVSDVNISLLDDSFAPAEFRLGETDAVIGTPLLISLPEGLVPESEFQLKVSYRTSPGASALQWLPAELTEGGKHPMMFTQSQAIHARSWVPLQDTPAVRITYSATIHTPGELLAVMSANNDPLTPRGGEYHFDMPQPIPSYLLALAVGNIFFAPLGDETGVYSEPEILDDAAFEFSDTQKMLDVAAELFGPYQWGRYDLLVLPPSFPYGGMENPRLSFITPSLLAGDKSLVATIAHELAHSWSGNLVTNATWRDQWLNEGMTSYLETRLMEVLYGKDRADEQRVLDYQRLLMFFETVPPAMQALAPRVDIGDPDDFQGTIHYDKGQLLLQYLENAYGRGAFDKFLDAYFNEFAFGTIASEQFVDYLDENLLQLQEGTVSRKQVEAWLYEPGLPADAPIPSSANLGKAETLATAWARGDVEAEALLNEGWSPQATVHFINSLPGNLSEQQLRQLDNALGLSDTGNSEVSNAWFIQVAKRQHRAAYDKMEQHLQTYGRMKFIFPVYRALADNGADLQLAREIYSSARENYHPIAIGGVSKILQLESD